MSKRDEKFWELNRQFDSNEEKFMWLNGAEFGTLIGCIATLFTPVYWWLFCAFWVEFLGASYYQHKNKKILAEMDKLLKGGNNVSNE